MEVNEPHPKSWIRPSTHQTEAGLLPLDWSAAALSDLLSSKQLGGNYKNGAAETAWPLIKMGNLGRGRIDCKKVEYIHSSASPAVRDRLQTGDVLFNTRNTLELVGKVAIWRDELPEAYFNSNIMRMRFDAGRVGSNAYMNYVLNTSRSISAFRSIATGTTSVAAIYGRDFQNVYLPLPSSKTEQRDIAEALADTDALIESLEQLLTKKRQIKQGAMQELLTGKRRLPGFFLPWRTYRLDEIADPVAQFNRDTTQLPVITCSKHLGFVDSLGFFKSQVFSNDTSTYKVVLRGQLAYPANHIEEGSIGYQDLYEEALVSPIYVVFQPRTGTNGKFLHRLLKLPQFLPVFGRLTSSSVNRRGSLRWQAFSTIEVAIPAEEEQFEVVQVIEALESEVAALEARLTKARALKQAMAQALLTGRIRLPVAT